MANRKDHKGRVLKTGESQRKDLLYQYRYTDSNGKRHTVYAPTLQELREKEKDIQRDIDAGVVKDDSITVAKVVELYLELRQNIAASTQYEMIRRLKVIKKYPFANHKISKITKTDAKRIIIELKNNKLNPQPYYAILNKAFQMAVDDDLLLKNPFSFNLYDIIPPKRYKIREALTADQQYRFAQFLQNDIVGKKSYDIFVVLIGTGMRVSELCGLTINDIDFVKGMITVNHQLLHHANKGTYISIPKTQSGYRHIPMLDTVRAALLRIISNRPKVDKEPCVDGYSGFVLLKKKGTVYLRIDIDQKFTTLTQRYNRISDIKIPTITPHVLRHTFCTNLALAGVHPKNIQYVMGHGDISVTLNTYTHTNYEIANQDIRQSLQQQKSTHFTTPITTPIAPQLINRYVDL